MRRLGVAFCVAAATSLVGGCNSSSGGQGVLDTLLYAGFTPPPIQTAQAEDLYCPTVEVTEGGAALQSYAGGRVGDAQALRNQIALGQLARECSPGPNGATLVKIGVEGRALIGAGGSAGRFNVPVRIQVKDGDRVLATRLQRTSVTIPSGQTQGSFVVVEDGITVPPQSANSFTIEVGLASR
jgi:hypothetical protein